MPRLGAGLDGRLLCHRLLLGLCNDADSSIPLPADSYISGFTFSRTVISRCLVISQRNACSSNCHFRFLLFSRYSRSSILAVPRTDTDRGSDSVLSIDLETSKDDFSHTIILPIPSLPRRDALHDRSGVRIRDRIHAGGYGLGTGNISVYNWTRTEKEDRKE